MKSDGMEKNSQFPVWIFESRILRHAWANTNVALVYSYMLARYRFHNGRGRDYFESYEYIAEKVGLSVRTVKKIVSLLNKNKHLEIKKRRTPAGINNVYIVVDIYGTWNSKGEKSSQEHCRSALEPQKTLPVTLAEELAADLERERESLAVSNKNSVKSVKKEIIYNNDWGLPDHELPPWERNTKEPTPSSVPSKPIVREKKIYDEDESKMPF